MHSLNTNRQGYMSNPPRPIFMTHTHVKARSEISLFSKDRAETDGRTDMADCSTFPPMRLVLRLCNARFQDV